MSDNLYRWFGLIIAQLLPGLLVVYGLSFTSRTIREWLGTATAQQVTVGSALLVVLTAVFCGLLLSAMRFLVFERLLRVDDGTRPANHAKLTEPGKEAAYTSIVVHHYAYYQFYGSAALAIPIFLLLWLVSPNGPSLKWLVVLLGMPLAFGVCYVAATDAMKRFLDKRAQILSVEPR